MRRECEEKHHFVITATQNKQIDKRSFYSVKVKKNKKN